MTIIFEPQYGIGDIVCLKIDPETKYVINAYSIDKVSNEGEVIDFRYCMYNREGTTFYYNDIDIQLIESISQ